MASRGVNKVILVGNLGQDPEVRYMPNGNAVANISLATSESWKDQQGQLQERTEWHRVTLYRKLGEIAGQYLRKGSQVYIEGKLQTRKWQDQQGQDRYTTEIIADQMQMLGGRQQDGGGFQGQNAGGFNQGTPAAQSQPQYQSFPNQGGAPQQAAPQQNAPNQMQGSNQGFNQGGQRPQPAQSQAPQSQPQQPGNMAEPDFDFDDDIPF